MDIEFTLAECGRQPVTLNARILRVECCKLLVCSLCDCQEYVVHTDEACRFQVGQRVCITYDGTSTMSIPPQIHASCIKLLNCCC